jgi:LysM repeat protein
VPREDWKLRVEVQMNDTLTSIAQKFSIDIWTLAAANCLKDMNMIRVGQQLRVPGDSLPQEPAVVCSEFTVLQPIDRASGIPASGQLVFNWEGPDSPRNLLRLYPPDYDFNVHDPSRYKEYVFDLRHNETVNLADLPEGGKWHWQIFPLDWGFTQVCPESPLWAFNKAP